MAQWMRQFSGNTHATKVQDLEIVLRKAVAALGAASPGKERETKAKSVRKVAERLLSARSKMLKARLDAARTGQESESEEGSGISSLRQRIVRLSEEGLDGILVEFGAEDSRP